MTRVGNTVVARTELGRAERVVLAGHLDTVPLSDPEPADPPRDAQGGEVLWGRGTVDMKGGVAVLLRVAHEVPEPSRDVTCVFYDAEEIESRAQRPAARRRSSAPELLADADFAVLLEPTDGRVEGGCKGTLRVEVSTKGIAAHSARPWMGAQRHPRRRRGPGPARPRTNRPRRVVDGLDYREGLNAVRISGGVAGNVIPDRCVVDGQLPLRALADRGRRPRPTCARCSPASTSTWSTTPAARARACTCRRPRRSSRRWACRSRPSRAGPTSPASPRSGCPPSTSAPATRTWPTWTTSSARSSSTPPARQRLLRWLA